MKKYLIFIGIFAVIAVGFWLLHPAHKPAKPSSGSNIVAFGDSLTAGQGASAGKDYPSDLSVIIGQPVINAGVSGDTTAQALGRIDNDVMSKDPKIVIVLLGANDFFQKIPIATTEQNLDQIIEKIQMTGASAVLVGVRLDLFSESYSSMYSRVAKKYNLEYVPNIMDGILGHSELMSDEIHPNDAGYKIIAERVAPQVKNLLK
jgi:acyl-CoA thioesterase-1